MQPHSITGRDYMIAALVGFLTGVCAIPTFVNIGWGTSPMRIFLIFGIPLLWVFGVWFGGFLSRWLPFMAQFGKFAAVGFLSAAIDFGVLNILSSATGVTSGFVIGGVNIPGFSVAVVNGYLWNKLWVFKDRDPEGLFHDFPKFLAVTGVGLTINSGVVVFVTSFVQPLSGVRPEAWLNIAKVGANAFVLVWNFLGYKFFVFKK